MKKKRTVYAPTELRQILLPLVQRLGQLHQKKKNNKKDKNNKTIIIGLQGGQGTGKTTLGNFLGRELRKRGYRVTSFSLDDFYESAEQRRKLQNQYLHNPFYQIARGMPGTHRVALLRKTLPQLKQGKDAQLPLFDKSLYHGFGDIAGKTISITSRQDFIIFEGWCLGIPPVSSKMVVDICRHNKIRLSDLDPRLQYHKIVLGYIKRYQSLWKFIDYLIMLKPDSSRLHLQWRIQQERGLRTKTGRKSMANKEIEHFVNVYLPFTYVCYEKVRPEVMLRIDKKHRIYKAIYF